MRVRTAIILILLLALGGGAIFYYERQVSLLQRLTYEIISIYITQATVELATINLVIRIHSSSKLDAKVKGLYIDVYLNRQKIGSVNSNQGFIIPAKGYSDAPIQVNISPELLVGDLATLVMGISTSKDMPVELVGYVQITEAFLNIAVPFQYVTSVKEILS